MAFVSFLRTVGAPVDRRLRCHGLPVFCQDPEAYVPLLRAWSFFDAVAQLDVPEVGWLAGRHVGDHNLHSGLLSRLERAPTLLPALLRLIREVNTEASHIQLGIHERRDDVLLYVHYPHLREEPGFGESQFYQLQVLLAVVRHFVGPLWIPDEIGTECSVVPIVAQEDLDGCRIRTRQSTGYIAVPRTYLHKRVYRVDSGPGQARSSPLSEHRDYADVLRAVLRGYLNQGYPTAKFAATLMDTSVRTLARRLSACGLTYGELIDDLRFTRAKELLCQTDAQLSDVAWSVGFDDQSHFTRMFRRVGGLTPGQMRKVALADRA
jgi:AraC-like DNA-binding protein